MIDQEEWLSVNATLHCARMHTRLSERSCVLFQQRYDKENQRNYSTGSYATSIPHPCAGCENYIQHGQRKKIELGRIKPPTKPSEKTSGYQPKGRITRTFRCWRCKTEDQDAFYEKQKMQHQTGIKSVISILCINCQKEVSSERNKKRVRVVCPVCKKSREVSVGMAGKKGFTGRCQSCANIKKKKKSIPPNSKPGIDYSGLQGMIEEGLSAKEIGAKLGVTDKTIFNQLKKQGINTPTKQIKLQSKWICRNCGPLPIDRFYPGNRTLCKRCIVDRAKARRVDI